MDELTEIRKVFWARYKKAQRAHNFKIPPMDEVIADWDRAGVLQNVTVVKNEQRGLAYEVVRGLAYEVVWQFTLFGMSNMLTLVFRPQDSTVRAHGGLNAQYDMDDLGVRHNYGNAFILGLSETKQGQVVPLQVDLEEFLANVSDPYTALVLVARLNSAFEDLLSSVWIDADGSILLQD